VPYPGYTLFMTSAARVIVAKTINQNVSKVVNQTVTIYSLSSFFTMKIKVVKMIYTVTINVFIQ